MQLQPIIFSSVKEPHHTLISPKKNMKKIVFIFGCMITLLSANAQSAKLKEIRQGTILQLDALSQGQVYPLTLTVVSATDAELVFAFDIMGNMNGKFINGKSSLEKGVRFNWDEPFAGEERKVPDDQTLLIISRSVLQELKNSKKSNFNNQELVLKDLPAGAELTINNIQIDIVYAESADGATKYWILNNDMFPVVMKLEGNPGGIDLLVKDFK